MASSQKEYSKEKLFWQIYTPEFIVCKILDEVLYNNINILWKTILDPACWDGRFLSEIVKRIIQYSHKKDLEKNLLNIYGWDIDEDAINQCINNLNWLIKDFNFNISWNIKINNSLHTIITQQNLFNENKNQNLKFDFIVWNPPYIRIQHLDKSERGFIQKNFEFCHLGSTDIFIAFFELSKKLLNENWICSFITPNSYFTTETWKKFRNFLANNHLISLYDFWWIQVFDNAITYTCITTFDNKKHDNFNYYKAINQTTFDNKIFNTSVLQNTKFWQLSIEDKIKKNGTRLGDICKIFVWLATLSDKAYIFDLDSEEWNYYFVNTKFSWRIKIEKSILQPIIKVSKNKKQFILFPYEKINDKHKIFDENKLKNNFPLAYEYLLNIRNILEKRSNGTSTKIKWYEFWRNQSLDSSFWKKIIFSTMNEKPKFILIEDEKSTFYSWYGIKYDWDYEFLLSKLNSQEMQDFINVSWRDLRWWWKTYSKKIIDEFMF